MGLTAMISFDLNKLKQGKRLPFHAALERDKWRSIVEVNTTWWKELASSDFDDAFKEVTESFHEVARFAEITEYEVVVHIGYMEPKLIPPLP